MKRASIGKFFVRFGEPQKVTKQVHVKAKPNWEETFNTRIKTRMIFNNAPKEVQRRIENRIGN